MLGFYRVALKHPNTLRQGSEVVEDQKKNHGPQSAKFMLYLNDDLLKPILEKEKQPGHKRVHGKRSPGAPLSLRTVER